jgi:hypothetical protein
VVLTQLHTDHAEGLRHSRVIGAAPEKVAA